MIKPISILMYGRDAHLLETRQWVLEAAGFRVRTATELRQVDCALAATSFDLFIMCHSLSPEDCERASVFAAVRLPRMKVLVLAAGDRGCRGGMLNSVLNAIEGPAKLISTVEHLTGSQTSNQTHLCR